MIDEDSSNNSAWSYRYFIVAHTLPFSAEIYSNEIKEGLKYL